MSGSTAKFVALYLGLSAALGANAGQFGHGQLANFMMAPGYTNLNHGAFGTASRVAAASQNNYYMQMEADANIWFRGGYQPPLLDVRTRLAKYVNAQSQDLVLVENASSGVNAVMRALADTLPLNPGDKILLMNIAYPMVKNVATYLAKVRQLQLVVANITFPLNSDDAFIVPVQQAIQQYGKSVKIASFDHISSYPPCILPIQKLVQICHDAGILVVVDGAHVLGQIPLDLEAINPDFYIANAHKWMYSPKGSAMLFVRRELQPLIVPTVISSEFEGDFVTKFQYTGTRDYCAFLAVGAAMDFRAQQDDAAIMQYIHSLAWQAGQAVAAIWNSSLLIPNEAMVPALAAVIVPTTNTTKAYGAQKQLLAQYNTYTQLGITDTGLIYMRLSGQIYLELSDFTIMGQRYLQLLQTA